MLLLPQEPFCCGNTKQAQGVVDVDVTSPNFLICSFRALVRPRELFSVVYYIDKCVDGSVVFMPCESKGLARATSRVIQIHKLITVGDPNLVAIYRSIYHNNITKEKACHIEIVAMIVLQNFL